MGAFLLYLIPVGFFLIFFGVQYGVNRLTKRLWVRLIPAALLFVATVALGIADYSQGGVWDGLITLLVTVHASLPGLLGAVVGAVISWFRAKKQKEKDGEVIER